MSESLTSVRVIKIPVTQLYCRNCESVYDVPRSTFDLDSEPPLPRGGLGTGRDLCPLEVDYT